MKDTTPIQQFITGNFCWALEFINCFLNFYLFPSIRIRLGLFNREQILNGPDYQRYIRWTLRIFNIKINLVNSYQVDLSKQYIMIANHSSWFDQPVFASLPKRPAHFMAKSDYLKIPILGQGLKLHQEIFVNAENYKEVQEQCFNYLRAGHNLCIYPEGTRSLGQNNLLPFRRGAFKFSASSQIPILPVFIQNTDQILIKSKPLWQVRRGADVFLHIGQPIQITQEQMDESCETLSKKYQAFVKDSITSKTNW